MNKHKPCPDCGDDIPENFHQGAHYCKPCISKRSKNWRAKNIGRIRETHRLQAQRWRKDNTHRYRKSDSDRRQRMRQTCIVKLGGKCVWPEGCYWTDPRALQIDHVHGGGTSERKQLNSAVSFYKKVLADTDGNYQLLCACHNAIKKIINHEYHAKNTQGHL